MPVIVVAPNNELLEKLKSNIEEVRARGGQLYVFADQDAGFVSSDNMHIIEMPHVEEVIAPIFYTVPLQLLAYHVALIKGTPTLTSRVTWQNRLRLSNKWMPCVSGAFSSCYVFNQTSCQLHVTNRHLRLLFLCHRMKIFLSSLRY